MVKGPEPHGFDGVLRAGKRGQHHDRRRIVTRANAAENVDAIESAGHPQVKQHGIDFLRKGSQTLAAGRRCQSCVAEIGQGLGQSLAQCRIIINNQNGRHGTSISKVAPHPAAMNRASP